MAAERPNQTHTNGLSLEEQLLLEAQLNQLRKELDQINQTRSSLALFEAGVPGGTTVLLTSGQRVPIRDLINRKVEIWTMADDWKITSGHCVDVLSLGSHPVIKLTLASGRVIKASGRQCLFGAYGWVRIENLKLDDRIAMARKIPEPTNPLTWPKDHLLLLGHMSGDGSYLKHQPLRYTSESEENLRAVKEAAERAFGVTVNRYEGVGNWYQLIFSGNGNRWHPSAMNQWFRDLGIFDQHSHIKHLPCEVFCLGDAQIAYLLQHSWATDGCVYNPNPNKRDKPRIFFATCSRKLIEDIGVLLLRLGFVGRIHEISQKSGNPLFTIDVSGADNQRRFLEAIGAFGPRSEPARKVLSYLKKIIANTNVDTLPKDIVYTEIQKKIQQLTAYQLAALRRRRPPYRLTSELPHDPSRKTVAEYARLLNSDKLHEMANSDLFWDQIIKIEPGSDEATYGLVVPGTANWLNDGIICHDATE